MSTPQWVAASRTSTVSGRSYWIVQKVFGSNAVVLTLETGAGRARRFTTRHRAEVAAGEANDPNSPVLIPGLTTPTTGAP